MFFPFFLSFFVYLYDMHRCVLVVSLSKTPIDFLIVKGNLPRCNHVPLKLEKFVNRVQFCLVTIFFRCSLLQKLKKI